MNIIKICALLMLSFMCVLPAQAEDSAKPNVMVFGEIHGTEQIPAFFRHWVAEQRANGERLLVALEIRASEQPVMDAIQNGTFTGGKAPPTGEFWRGMQDGRKSQAFWHLMNILAGWQDISLLAMDGAHEGMTRDESMARRIRQAVTDNPGITRVAVLVGSAHAIKHKVTNQLTGKDFTPLARILSRDMPVTSLKAAHTGGTAWMCYAGKDGKPACGVKQREPTQQADGIAPGSIVISDGLNPDYDGYFFVGEISASLPAIDAQASINDFTVSSVSASSAGLSQRIR